VVSGSALVLVDDPAEDVATGDLAICDGGRRAGDRLVEIEAAMRPGFVVKAEVLGEHGLEMSLRDNEEVVEALLADVRTNLSAKAFARGEATGFVLSRRQSTRAGCRSFR
jgi:hypothetical protein